jgi:hypothetical protein
MWTFNKDYGDYSQVEQFLPAFLARHAEIVAAGQYPYNDSFKGHLPGLEDSPSQDSAIYMLQGLKDRNEQDAREAALVAQGYEYVASVTGVQRFAHICLCPTGRMNGDWAEFREARLIGYDSGEPRAIIPKGKRTHGALISGRRVLALR